MLLLSRPCALLATGLSTGGGAAYLSSRAFARGCSDPARNHWRTYHEWSSSAECIKSLTYREGPTGKSVTFRAVHLLARCLASAHSEAALKRSKQKDNEASVTCIDFPCHQVLRCYYFRCKRYLVCTAFLTRALGRRWPPASMEVSQISGERKKNCMLQPFQRTLDLRSLKLSCICKSVSAQYTVVRETALNTYAKITMKKTMIL
jgi:hypothetical protein